MRAERFSTCHPDITCFVLRYAGTMLEKEERLRTLGDFFTELRRNALVAEEVRDLRDERACKCGMFAWPTRA